MDQHAVSEQHGRDEFVWTLYGAVGFPEKVFLDRQHAIGRCALPVDIPVI